jgi:hypothetical protein
MPDWQSRPTPPPSLKPRRVRGGVRPQSGILAPLKDGGSLEQLSSEASTSRWGAHRILRLIEQTGAGASIREGLEYLTSGQIRKVSLEGGALVGSVQGRQFKAYSTVLKVPAISEEDWSKIVPSMADQAIYGAKLLAGELPPGIEELFQPMGLKLVPTEPTEIECECNCSRTKPWCVHQICLAYLLADQLAETPALIFSLRGLPIEDLLDRLRQRRMVTASAVGSTAVYVQRAPDVVLPPLDQCTERYFDSGGQLAELSLPLEPPAVSHPLLRRLGPSPFADSRFPLVGLLATCYDVISQASLVSSQSDNESGPEDLASDEERAADNEESESV